MKYKCVTDGFKTRGYKNNNLDSKKWVSVVNGDVLECDGECIVKDGISLCHKDSILGKYHFRKVDK